MKNITAAIITCTCSILGMILLGVTILATFLQWTSLWNTIQSYNFFELLNQCGLVPLFISALTMTIGGYVMALIVLCKTDK